MPQPAELDDQVRAFKVRNFPFGRKNVWSEHRSDSIGAAAGSSARWSLAGRLLIQALQLVSTVVLARFLSPADFGLVASASVFTGFAILLTDLGIGPAVVHHPRLSQSYCATAFWLNAASGVLLTALVLILSPVIAQVGGDERLQFLVMVGSLAFTFSLGVVPVAILERLLAFKPVLVIEGLAALGGLSVSVTLGVVGVGPVSIVCGSVTQAVLLSLLAFHQLQWRPGFVFNRTDLRALFSFSSHLMIFNSVNYWGRNGDNLLVGRVLGPTILGFYARAYALMLAPVSATAAALGRAVLPILSRTAPGVTLRDRFLRITTITGLVGFPLAFVLAVIARPLIQTLYGRSWSGAAAPLLILALSAPPQILNGALGAFYQATNQTAKLARRGIFGAVLCIASIAIGLQFGLRGACIAYCVQAYLNTIVAAVPVARTLGISTVKYCHACLPGLQAGVLGFAIAFPLGWITDARLPDPASLVLLGAVFCAAYLLILRVFTPNSFSEFRALISLQRGGA